MLSCHLEIVESYYKNALDIQSKIEVIDSADDGRSEVFLNQKFVQLYHQEKQTTIL